MAKHHRPEGVRSGMGTLDVIERVIVWCAAFGVGLFGILILMHAIALMEGEVWL